MSHFYNKNLCQTLLNNINELSAATGTLPFNSIKRMCEMAPHLKSMMYRGHGSTVVVSLKEADEGETSQQQLDTKKEKAPENETAGEKRQRIRRDQELKQQQQERQRKTKETHQSFYLCLVRKNSQNLGVVTLF